MILQAQAQSSSPFHQAIAIPIKEMEISTNKFGGSIQVSDFKLPHKKEYTYNNKYIRKRNTQIPYDARFAEPCPGIMTNHTVLILTA